MFSSLLVATFLSIPTSHPFTAPTYARLPVCSVVSLSQRLKMPTLPKITERILRLVPSPFDMRGQSDSGYSGSSGSTRIPRGAIKLAILLVFGGCGLLWRLVAGSSDD